jgi:hypothetical protein
MIKGADRLAKAFEALGKKAESVTLQVGFIDNAAYPNTGMSVAQVAFNNEYGTTKAPARPFFRPMISKEKGLWGAKLARQLKDSNYNVSKSAGSLGEDIVGALIQSIIDVKSPPLAQSTIDRKGSPKPLIDTKLMKDSIKSKVEHD